MAVVGKERNGIEDGNINNFVFIGGICLEKE